VILRRTRKTLAVVAVTVVVVLALPFGAAADDGDGREVRVSRSCSRGSDTMLRARTDDGSIRVELRIDPSRPGAWRVIFLHERRIAYRGTLRPSSSSGTVRLRRTVRDLYGRDTLVIRSSGPRGESCRIAVEL
jgi:hypothetical protein